MGVLFITAFVFSDLIDGQMARKMGRKSRFGAFWDSTLDRIGDAAFFGGLALYFAGSLPGRRLPLPVRGPVVPGDGLGDVLRPGPRGVARHGARGGIAERADRLVSILVMTGLAGIFDLPILMQVTLWALAVAQHLHRGLPGAEGTTDRRSCSTRGRAVHGRTPG